MAAIIKFITQEQYDFIFNLRGEGDGFILVPPDQIAGLAEQLGKSEAETLELDGTTVEYDYLGEPDLVLDWVREARGGCFASDAIIKAVAGREP